MIVRECLDALEAIREALDIPYAATVGDELIRAKIMEQRVMHTAGTLERIRREVVGQMLDYTANDAWY
jgi:hypothetical protein